MFHKLDSWFAVKALENIFPQNILNSLKRLFFKNFNHNIQKRYFAQYFALNASVSLVKMEILQLGIMYRELRNSLIFHDVASSVANSKFARARYDFYQ